MKIKSIILGVIIVIGVFFAYYMVEKSKYAHSEAVFVATDSLTNLSFKLKGEISTMTKNEGDKIKKGELLASLQTKTLNAKLQQTIYNIKALKQNISVLNLTKENTQTKLKEQLKIANNDYNKASLDIQALQYQIQANIEKLHNLKEDVKKFQKLYKLKKVSYEKYSKINTEYLYQKNLIQAQKTTKKANEIALQNIKNKITIIKSDFKKLDILNKQINITKDKLSSLEMVKKQIQIKLQDSKLYAPFDGVVAKKFVNPNWVVDAGSYVYSIVNPKDIYIKVLLSEKKLKGVKIGNKATITIDAFGDKKFYGKVSNIAPVSASTFSLVPRDIASGEFTKLDQRFVVKIKLNKYYPNLRIGMGGEVKIDKSN